jgi:hypothetical protein
MGITEPRDQKQIHFCAICGGPGTSRHHLVPRGVRGQISPNPRTELIRTCASCHREIHYYFSHWELALRFNTEERIKTELAKRKVWKLSSGPNDKAEAPGGESRFAAAQC